jgi:hypothetical protein
MTPEDVFVTEGYPEHTYVDRDDGKPDRDLKDALSQKSKIVSIIGASKTGKTTLCDRFFGRHKGTTKILVTGDAISSPDAFWSEAYRQLKGGAASSYYEVSYTFAKDEFVERGLPIIIDDFHYIESDVQRQLCRQMKNAASEGIRFIILNTPHRGDDPVRNNPDLAGRFFSIDVGFWNSQDLARIATKGFAALGISADPDVVDAIASEALGSPQLMQTLCLETCRLLNSDVPYDRQSITSETLSLPAVRSRAIRTYDQATQLHFLTEGRPERGKERRTHTFLDGTIGDLYQALVKVLRTDPPFNKITLSEMKERLRDICSDDPAPNIAGALDQLHKLFRDGPPPIEWDDDKLLLTIVDPHFYFYLRCAE